MSIANFFRELRSMFKYGFFRSLAAKWHSANYQRLLEEHAAIKKRFIELTSDKDNCDPNHLFRISEYARMMCSCEVQLKEYGYTP